MLIKLISQAEDYFSASIAKRTRDFNGAASAYSTDVDGEPLNTLVIRNSVRSLDSLIKETADFFALANTSWCIVMRAELATLDVNETLKRHGFMPADVSVAMALSLNQISFAQNESVKNMDDKLDTWAIPLSAFPATSDDINIKYARSHKLALERKRNMSHSSLFKDNEIISSMTLSWNDNWARIDDVATLHQYQRQGYATALMRYGIGLAAQKGAKHCFLEASPKGLSIYQKLGFKELFKNQVFTKRKST
ncbi:MAG TPA: GNAT family N-acetyltransferase [Myxococcota bacterium]|nr:GNAT family N-acetyltransferase [Myxococcota bacterium]